MKGTRRETSEQIGTGNEDSRRYFNERVISLESAYPSLAKL